MPERFILRPISSIFNLRINNKGISAVLKEARAKGFIK